MKKSAAILVLILCVVGIAYAQHSVTVNLPAGSTVYIEPMNGFENYLAAALQEK